MVYSTRMNLVLVLTVVCRLQSMCLFETWLNPVYLGGVAIILSTVWQNIPLSFSSYVNNLAGNRGYSLLLVWAFIYVCRTVYMGRFCVSVWALRWGGAESMTIANLHTARQAISASTTPRNTSSARPTAHLRGWVNVPERLWIASGMGSRSFHHTQSTITASTVAFHTNELRKDVI